MFFSKPPLGTPLDWGNPLNDQTVMALAMNEGHGDKVQDLSLNGNHGTLNNFAFPPTVDSGWNPGQTGIGLNFDGGDDYINCNPFIGLSSTNEVTTSALVYPTEGGRTQGIINPRSVATADTLVMRYSSGNVIDAIYWNTADDGQVVSGSTTIQLNEWQNWIFVLSGNNVKIYINGILDADEDKTGTLIQTTDHMDIGRYSNTYFNGPIDQPRIQSRAWSAKEVRDYAMNPWQVYLDEDD